MPSLMTMIRKSSSKHANKHTDAHQESKSSHPTYDLSLIGSLKYDHEQILDIYDQILLAALKEEFSEIQPLLKEFSTALTNHLQVEDELLYGYLKIIANQKSFTAKNVVNNFSSEMKNISIEIFSFLGQSNSIPVNEKTVTEFIKGFKQIGQALQKRVEHEETALYPIYKDSRKVVNIT